MLEVLATGPLATVQDLGRPGYAHLGVPRSGALDQPALERANRLVGNSLDKAGLELSQGRFAAVFHAEALIAVTGAPADVRVDETMVRGATTVAKGQKLEIGAPTSGMHCYLAVRGGIDVPEVLGSRSSDTLSGIGPAPLRAGTRLPFGESTGVPFSAGPEPDYGEVIQLRIRFGPRESWFRSPEELTWNAYRMGMANRIGARLTGPSLNRAIVRELPSEGLVPGAVQVPGDGLPIIFLADHPTTGGYPVLAVVHPADLPLVAQARPGARVMFRGP
jgi:biotin-dependent carboxylase-like uncharacterized protein